MTIKVAINGPQWLMKRYNWGDIHYALAHECIDDNESIYFYRYSKKTVILDNGADELGAGMRGDDYLCLIAEIQPDVVILPDVLSDAKETRERSLTFLDEARTIQKMYGYEYMAVIQGQSEEEWLEEFEFWSQHPKSVNDHSVHIALHPAIRFLGVPYDIDFSVSGAYDGVKEPEKLTLAMQRAYKRVKLLEKIREKFGLAFFIPRIHLLGINELYEFHLIYERKLQSIVYSNDTTAPYAAAMSNKSFVVDRGVISSGEKDWDRLDFKIQHISDKTEELLVRNLVMYKEAVNPIRSYRE